MTVPAPARQFIGKTKLVHPLGTDSLRVANVLKKPHVEAFRRRIQLAMDSVGLAHDDDLKTALQLAAVAAEMRDAGHTDFDDFNAAVYDRQAEIRFTGARLATIVDEETGTSEIEVELPEQAAKADLFSAVAHGRATPVDVLHLEYRAQLDVEDRTRADDARALRYLRDWCTREGRPFVLERFDTKRAWAFADALPELTGTTPVTCNKYLSRLSGYWAFLSRRVDAAPVNVFHGVSLRKRKGGAAAEERAFTNLELATLLAGPATPQMLDLMRIGALSGARLDAIVDLGVGDVDRGCFVFKAQKREVRPRYVPIHPDLAEVVARRTAGKGPAEDLFPEWPPVQKEGSLRERSFKASNHFTDYRRLVGVKDEAPGRRRSLVNFHSFRRWFISRLEQADVPKDLIAAIVGHRRGSITLDVYSEGPAMRSARRAIRKLSLPDLDKGRVIEPDRLLRR